MKSWFIVLPVSALVIALLTAACGGAAPAPTAAPAKPAAPPTTAPAAPTVGPTAPAAVAAATPAAPGAAWTPERDVEFVVHAAAGGGSDIQARIMEKAIKDNNLYPRNIAVVNRVGGSGAVAFAYVAQKRGDPYTWLTATTSFFTTPARGQVPLDPTKDFTMLARLSDDNFTVVVRNESPFRAVQDVINAAKANPNSIRWGGTNVGSDDHIFMYLLQRATGTQFNFISLQSGGEVVTNLLGGHVDVASANLAEVLPQVQANRVRILAVGSDRKLDKYPDIPTLQEQGIDMVYTQTRMIAAPAGLPAAAREYWADLFRRMVETQVWRDYVNTNDQQSAFMVGAELDRYVADFNGQIITLVRDLGLVEKK